MAQKDLALAYLKFSPTSTLLNAIATLKADLFETVR
jgi:hypothetical protein